jgi:hypothetical protein
VEFRRVGFFRESCGGDASLPSIRGAVRPTPHPNAERIVAYLNSGIRDEVLFCRHYVTDVLTPGKRFCVAPGPITDGVWIWPPDLAYYVRHYNVSLPEAFIAQMRQSVWALPALSAAQRSELDEQLLLYMLGKLPWTPSET